MDLIYNAIRYTLKKVIRSFKSKETEVVWGGKISRKLPSKMQRSALRKLLLINSAEVLDDLRLPPGNKLEGLKGNSSGQHSIRINDQWRVCFYFKNKDAYDVEIVDYH